MMNMSIIFFLKYQSYFFNNRFGLRKFSKRILSCTNNESQSQNDRVRTVLKSNKNIDFDQLTAATRSVPDLKPYLMC